MTRRPISEDDIQAFVDEQLDDERRDEVARYLSNQPETAARVADYARQARAMRDAMNSVADEPIPNRLNLSAMAARSTGRATRYWRMGAAALVLLTLGGTGGWTLRALSTAPTGGVALLAQEAASSFRAFAPDKIRPVEVRADGSRAIAELTSVALGEEVAMPDLSMSGYRLMGGRVVPTLHGPGVMLMFDNDSGDRVVLLTRRMAVDQNKPMMPTQQDGVNGWSWAASGIGFSLVGALPPSELHPLADDVRTQTAL